MGPPGMTQRTRPATRLLPYGPDGDAGRGCRKPRYSLSPPGTAVGMWPLQALALEPFYTHYSHSSKKRCHAHCILILYLLSPEFKSRCRHVIHKNDVFKRIG